MIPLRGVVLDGSAMQMAVVDEMRRASRGHSGWENLAHGMGWALGLLGPVRWDISSEKASKMLGDEDIEPPLLRKSIFLCAKIKWNMFDIFPYHFIPFSLCVTSFLSPYLVVLPLF